ncbi:MAG: GNAT family N-acetyltransferase [Planctomycetota bacterium]
MTTQLPTLKTERLVLRPFRPEDAGDVQRLAGDRAIADTTQNIPHPYEDGMAEEWIAKHQAIFDGGTGVTFAITLKSTSELIGAISLMGIIRGHRAELGYWIGRPYWRQGYCTEAARAVVRYGFEELDLNRIHATHFSRNPASGRVMQKLGMTHEGRRRQHVLKWGRFEDLELYGMLREEYVGVRNNNV